MALLGAADLVASGKVAAQSALSDLLTRAERTDFVETSSYDDVMALSRQLAELSDQIHLTTFGYTNEGRALPLLVVGAPDASAEAVRATGKTRIYLQGNIHAGEVCGKKALLMLLREYAEGGYPAWTDALVLLVAPIYNADGNERVDLGNRPRQHGPIGGMGQRPNAQGLDLNRDHMKLDSPEARSLVAMMTAYDPHVGVVEEILDFAQENATRIGEVVEEAELEGVVGRSLATQADFERSGPRPATWSSSAFASIPPGWRSGPSRGAANALCSANGKRWSSRFLRARSWCR